MPFDDLFSRIRIFLNDKNKKPLGLIIKEVFSVWGTKKSFPLFYFGRFFYRQGMPSPNRYLNLKEYYKIIKSPKLNSSAYESFVTNKLAFSLFCEKNKVPIPKTLSHNMGNNFFLEEKMFVIKDKKECLDFFEKVFENSGEDKLFVKSVDGYGGREVHKLSKNSMNLEINDIMTDMFAGSYIHQEAIIQHPAIAKINPYSVNTLRLGTYIDSKGTTHFIGSFMRFGSGGKPVDNVSSGGFFVPFDLNSGRLLPRAFQAMIYGGKEFTSHPDSGFVFDGFEIPFFKEIKDLGIKLSKMLPNRLIGWDFAITEKGPLVLEANNFPGIIPGEFAQGGYVDHPIYKEIIG